MLLAQGFPFPPPHWRLLMYALTVQIRFQSSELVSLTREDLFLEEVYHPYVRCRPENAVSGTWMVRYIDPALGRPLAEFIADAGREGEEFIFDFGGTKSKCWTHWLRKDLAGARALWLKEGGDPSDRFLVPSEDFEFDKWLLELCGVWPAIDPSSCLTSSPPEIGAIQPPETLNAAVESVRVPPILVESGPPETVEVAKPQATVPRLESVTPQERVSGSFFSAGRQVDRVVRSVSRKLVPATLAHHTRIKPRKLADQQALLAHHVRVVANGFSNGLFVFGPGGLGKSWTVAQTLKELSIVPKIINSHITAFTLYKILYENRDSLIWLDDIEGIFVNIAALGLLRSALWGTDARTVTYNSRKSAPGIPDRFDFTGRMIFCSNQAPLTMPAFRALLTRVDVFRLDTTNDELLSLIRTLADRGCRGLSPEQCHEVANHLASRADDCILNMRLWELSLSKVEYAIKNGEADWRSMVDAQLDLNQANLAGWFAK
jgi:hypothetical protein